MLDRETKAVVTKNCAAQNKSKIEGACVIVGIDRDVVPSVGLETAAPLMILWLLWIGHGQPDGLWWSGPKLLVGPGWVELELLVGLKCLRSGCCQQTEFN